MICQNCQNVVDNDLVFCTECGTRLFEPTTENQMVLIPNSVVTKPNISESKSKLKWVVLIAVIIIVPIVLGIGVLLFMNLFSTKSNQQISKTKAEPTPTRKPANQNKQTNILVNNSNSENNSDWNKAQQNSNTPNNTEGVTKMEETILDEQVNVDANAHIAFPFKVTADSVKITGEVEILNGEQFEGYVFLQEIYDELSVKPDFKMFSFDSTQGKSTQIEQYLIKGNYVLVFANKDEQGVSVKAKFSQIEQYFLKE